MKIFFFHLFVKSIFEWNWYRCSVLMLKKNKDYYSLCQWIKNVHYAIWAFQNEVTFTLCKEFHLHRSKWGCTKVTIIKFPQRVIIKLLLQHLDAYFMFCLCIFVNQNAIRQGTYFFSKGPILSSNFCPLSFCLIRSTSISLSLYKKPRRESKSKMPSSSARSLFNWVSWFSVAQAPPLHSQSYQSVVCPSSQTLFLQFLVTLRHDTLVL